MNRTTVEGIWKVRDNRHIESSVEKEIVDHMCNVLLFAMLGSKTDLFDRMWYFILLLNSFVSPFSSYVERKIHRVIGKILGIKERGLGMIPTILGAAIVFIVSTITLHILVKWARAYDPTSDIRASVAMGLGSVFYSRCISRIIGRRPGVGRMIIIGVFMILMGKYTFKTLYSREQAGYNARGGYEIGRVSWDENKKVYDVDYNHGHEFEFSRVLSCVITPIFDRIGMVKEGREIRYVRVVDMPKGEVGVNFLHDEISISMNEVGESEELFRKILEAIALIREGKSYYHSYNHIVLKSVLLPITALMVVIVSRVLSGYINKESETEILLDWKDEMVYRTKMIWKYAIAYLIAGCLVCLVSLVAYRVLELLISTRHSKTVEEFVRKCISLPPPYSKISLSGQPPLYSEYPESLPPPYASK